MIVGLTGYKGHGKDTVANLLVRDHGFTLLRFADPLKNMLRGFYRTVGVPEFEIEARIEGHLKEQPDPWLMHVTPRQAMQTLGTEWGRHCVALNFWVATLVRRSKRLTNVVVPDVRYQNECHAIQQANGIVLQVDAGERVPANEFSNHSSEKEIRNLSVDGVIDNSGTYDDLKATVRTLTLHKFNARDFGNERATRELVQSG